MSREGRRQAVEEHKAARKALEENGRRERAQGIRDETPEYHEANQRVIDAEKRVSWWRR
jgi:hypothetical protein